MNFGFLRLLSSNYEPVRDRRTDGQARPVMRPISMAAQQKYVTLQNAPKSPLTFPGLPESSGDGGRPTSVNGSWKLATFVQMFQQRAAEMWWTSRRIPANSAAPDYCIRLDGHDDIMFPLTVIIQRFDNIVLVGREVISL